jgi:hypothetical protein
MIAREEGTADATRALLTEEDVRWREVRADEMSESMMGADELREIKLKK